MFRPVRIRNYVSYMATRGYPVDRVLAGSGISPTQMEDPELLINLHQCRRVVSNMIELTGDQGIGLDIGANTTVRDLGIVGHALIAAGTVRKSISMWVTYSNSLLGVPYRVEPILDNPNHWHMCITELSPMGFIYNFCVEEILMMFINIGRVLVGDTPQLVRLELSYPAPIHRELYYRAFDCPIKFNAERSCATFDFPNLDTPLSNTDDDFDSLCISRCTEILQRIARNTTTSAQVRSLLRENPKRPPSLEEAAESMRLSPRSLRRHLSNEETAYSQLLRECRIELTDECLLTMRMAPKEVAYVLGFNDVNTFRRAFKSWTGTTIGDYLKRHASQINPDTVTS